MLRLYVGFTITIFSFFVSPIALSQVNTESTQKDDVFLTILNLMLQKHENDEYDLSPAIKVVSDEDKIQLGRDFCSSLEKGFTYNELTIGLYSPQFDTQNSELSQYQREFLRQYMMTVLFVAIKHYCPEYEYQLRIN